MTVDEEAVHEEDEHHDRHLGWLWILIAILLLAGIGFGLHYFKVVDLNPMKVQTEKLGEIEPWKVTFPSVVRTWKIELIEPQTIDTALETNVVEEIVPFEETQEEVVQEPEPVEIVQEPEVVKEPEPVKPEANIRIIAGCFAEKENADRMANTLKDKGYDQSFVEKRGSKWFVAFGRYATDEEATAALRDIRVKGDDKAWILK